MVQSCYSTKLLLYKVASFKVATAIKWFQVPNRMINHRKSAKNCTVGPKILQLACQDSLSVQLDLRSQAMSNVNFFTTAQGGKQGHLKVANAI
jgi:hypothetical protein